MSIHDPYLEPLRRQASCVDYAKRNLREAIAEDWRVLNHRLVLDSEESAYMRLLADTPAVSVAIHLRERANSIRA